MNRTAFITVERSPVAGLIYVKALSEEPAPKNVIALNKLEL